MRNDPRWVEQCGFDPGIEFGALLALRRFAHHYARDENRTVIAVEHELLIGHIHPDTIRWQVSWQPALAFKIRLNQALTVRLRPTRPVGLLMLLQGLT